MSKYYLIFFKQKSFHVSTYVEIYLFCLQANNIYANQRLLGGSKYKLI